MDLYSAALNLGYALRIFASSFDADNNTASRIIHELSQTNPRLASKFHVFEGSTGYYSDAWESALSHLIYSSTGRFDHTFKQMTLLISEPYARSQLRRCTSEEQADLLQLAARLLGKTGEVPTHV